MPSNLGNLGSGASLHHRLGSWHGTTALGLRPIAAHVNVNRVELVGESLLKIIS